MQKTKQNRGFTLLEMMLVLALLGVVAGLSLPVYQKFQTRNDLDIAANTAAFALRRAQVNARGSLLDDAWSVHFQNSKISIYEGATFSQGATLYATYSVPSTIQWSGLADVSYAKFSGYPVSTGSVNLRSITNEQRSVSINAKGTLTLQ